MTENTETKNFKRACDLYKCYVNGGRKTDIRDKEQVELYNLTKNMSMIECILVESAAE